MQRTRAIIGVAALALAAGGCGQPDVKCQTSRGDFAAKYKLVSGSGACSKLAGEHLGLSTYNYPQATNNKPDLDHASIAIQPETIGALAERAASQSLGDPDARHTTYASGDFDGPAPIDGICTATSLGVAEQELPKVPKVDPDPSDPKDKGLPEQPATRIRYSWGNVRVLVSAARFGSQVSADLVYTRDGCSATYSVVAVYPAASCADADGKPDERLCATEANPAAGIAYGSGINPDYAVACDPDLLTCVPSKDFPSLK